MRTRLHRRSTERSSFASVKFNQRDAVAGSPIPARVRAIHSSRRALRDPTPINSIRTRRIVIAAVLQIMESQRLSEPNAFALLRRTAMERRTTIEQLSVDIVATGEQAFWSTRTA
jgi:hypothetical protein